MFPSHQFTDKYFVRLAPNSLAGGRQVTQYLFLSQCFFTLAKLPDTQRRFPTKVSDLALLQHTSPLPGVRPRVALVVSMYLHIWVSIHSSPFCPHNFHILVFNGIKYTSNSRDPGSQYVNSRFQSPRTSEQTTSMSLSFHANNPLTTLPYFNPP